MGEDSKTGEMTVYKDGQPVQIAGGDLPEITMPEVSAGISVEQLTQAMASMTAIWEGITVTISDAAEGLREFFTAVARRLELKVAIRWAEIYNPRLVHFYRHTKKGRTRKKYAKRILAWYREEARQNVETESE
ncbi:MAG: hypothetical protein RRY97_10040 [Oscillibacter sp.]